MGVIRKEASRPCDDKDHALNGNSVATLKMDNHLPLLDNLRAAIQLACQPQNAHRIVEGRKQVLSMPRAWVLQSIETVASECLDLTDYWQYRRLLELAVDLDPNLFQRLVQMGVSSIDEDIREAANDFHVE